MRRPGGRSRRTERSSASAFNEVLYRAVRRPVFNADKVVEDPANPGFVLKIVDHNDPTHWLIQTDNTKQVAMPVAHADFGGRLCFTADGTRHYESNRSTTYWGLLHSGSPVRITSVFTSTLSAAVVKFMYGTSVGFDGLYVYQYSATTRVTAANAAATLIADGQQGAAVLNTPTYNTLLHGTSLTPDWAGYSKGTVARSGAYSSTPGPGASNFAFRLFGRPGAAGFVGRLREVVMGPDTGLDHYQDYINVAYGIAP